MILSSTAICDLGLIRSENQDNLYINGMFRRDMNSKLAFRHSDIQMEQGLYAVADGMGGEKNGATAALLAVQNLDAFNGGADGLKDYLAECNATICRMIEQMGGQRMGSTFAGVYISDGMANVVNIGDSKVFLFRGGSLTQLSLDHTVVRPMVEMGILTEKEVRGHPDRHRLTQHLGIFPDELIIEPYSTAIFLEQGDTFLLCSDGLTDCLENDEIAAILRNSNRLPEKAEELFVGVIRAGAKDNVTILLVQVMREEQL